MREVYIRDLNPTRLHKTLFSLSKHFSQRAGFLLFMPLLLSESSLSLGYKPQLTSLTLFAFIICYFCRCPSMSTPEITTPTPFFFLLSKMGHFQPQGQTFHSQIILDFRSLQPSFFFALLMPCNDTKLMSSFQTLKTAYSNGSTEKEKFSFM